MMKTKHAVALLVLGYCFDFIGAMFKITHSPSANTILWIGAALKVAGGLLFLYKLLNYPKFKEYMNS